MDGAMQQAPQPARQEVESVMAEFYANYLHLHGTRSLSRVPNRPASEHRQVNAMNSIDQTSAASSTTTTQVQNTPQQRATSPRKKGEPTLTEQASGKKRRLLPSSQPSPTNSPAAPRARLASSDSPYKPAASGPIPAPATDARAELKSLRVYLHSLRQDNLANAIFRDQTSAARDFPTAWTSQLQHALEEPVEALRDLEPFLEKAIAKAKKTGLIPAPGAAMDHFDWQPFANLCKTLWPKFAKQVLTIDSIPPLAIAMLAEVADELSELPAFLLLDQSIKTKVMSDTLFNLYIWTGVFSSLQKNMPKQYASVVDRLCLYVKGACGVTATTQGELGKAVTGLVSDQHRTEYKSFLDALSQKVEALAERRTVQFRDLRNVPELNRVHENNVARYFKSTWLTRKDDYRAVLIGGHYFLTEKGGASVRCLSYPAFRDYVGKGDRGTLPELILHVAGQRISNFLCQTYLYDSDMDLLEDTQGNKVHPVAELQPRFTFSRNDNGLITVYYVCTAAAAANVILVGNDETESDATPLLKGSLEFKGELRFYPDEQFESGEVEFTGRNFHLLQ